MITIKKSLKPLSVANYMAIQGIIFSRYPIVL